jgi:hypothetical protein
MKDLVRIFFISTMIFGLAARNLGAATVTVDGTGMRTLMLAISGPPVPVDSKVMVGYFAGLTDGAIIMDQGDPRFLDSKFVAFGPGGVVGEGTGEPLTAGRFTISTSATVEPPNPTFAAPTSLNNNQQIYVWTFDSNNLPTDATHQAIFTSMALNWRWPTTDDGLTDTSISLDDSLSVLVGGSNSNAVFMAPIPEPQPLALFGFGMIGSLVLRQVRRYCVSACRGKAVKSVRTWEWLNVAQAVAQSVRDTGWPVRRSSALADEGGKPMLPCLADPRRWLLFMRAHALRPPGKGTGETPILP